MKKAVILRRTALNVTLDIVLSFDMPCPMFVTLADLGTMPIILVQLFVQVV